MRMPLKEKSRILRKHQTEAELLLWEKLRAHRFHGVHFRRQYPIGNRFILDFYCSAAKLGIEIDGESHKKTEAQVYDGLRTENFFRNLPPLHIRGEGVRGRGQKSRAKSGP